MKWKLRGRVSGRLGKTPRPALWPDKAESSPKMTTLDMNRLIMDLREDRREDQ